MVLDNTKREKKHHPNSGFT